MRRAWLAVALLAGSWLLGLNYYQEPSGLTWLPVIGTASWSAWLAAVAGGVALLCAIDIARPPTRIEAAIALAMALPACWIAPGIYRAIPLLVAAGSAITLLAPPRPWLRRLGIAALLAGAILLVQGMALYAYESLTARSHDLPVPLASTVAGIARLIGADATLSVTAYGVNIDLFTMRRIHPLGATWELLLDPVTVCFAVGGILLILLHRATQRWSGVAALFLIVVAWLPLRVAILIGVYLHRALLTDYDAPLDIMSLFFSPWTHLALLAGPVFAAWRFVGPAGAPPAPVLAAPPRLSRLLVVPAALAGAGLLVAGLFFCPSGPIRPGRVLIDEFHSTWEPTGRAYDTEWYGHDSGYNYYCIQDYCSHFYETIRLTDPITPGTLRPGDVLIAKVPTEAYKPEEIERIDRFVRNGGGLMCIGEHTDVFGTSTHLNALTRRFGFTYRFDCAFGIRSVFEELYEQPLLPHPIVQRMPPLDFEISCTIDPGASSGRAAMRGTGLKNAFPDYHASNFYPQVDDFPDSRYGAFVQMWATEQDNGRVVAFSDSTQFSNFSTFEAGKPEMMIGMIEWLRHGNPRAKGLVELMTITGAALLLVALLATLVPARHPWAVVLAAGLLGWAIAVPTVRAANRHSLPLPKPQRPLVRVAIDRTVCDAVLSKAGFIGGRPDAFGIFDRWVLRLGWFPFRLSGDDVFTDTQLAVFLHPHLDVSREFRDKLVAYVKNGGHVLVLDSPENEHSTANSLLFPFKLAAKRPMVPLAGATVAARGWTLPSLPVASSLEIEGEGGKPVAQLSRGDGGPPVTVAATAMLGKGSITVVGFASRFTDQNMGVTGDMEPDPSLRPVYEFEYGLLRQIMHVAAHATAPTTAPAAP